MFPGWLSETYPQLHIPSTEVCTYILLKKKATQKINNRLKLRDIQDGLE